VKSKELLSSFVIYCLLHPEQRFWQALRNWSGFHFIYGSDEPDKAQIDTFYLEKKKP